VRRLSDAVRARERARTRGVDGCNPVRGRRTGLRTVRSVRACGSDRARAEVAETSLRARLRSAAGVMKSPRREFCPVCRLLTDALAALGESEGHRGRTLRSRTACAAHLTDVFTRSPRAAGYR